MNKVYDAKKATRVDRSPNLEHLQPHMINMAPQTSVDERGQWPGMPQISFVASGHLIPDSYIDTKTCKRK